MWEVAKVLGEMVSAGVISNYAIFGAIAQTRYTEPTVTLDVDVLVVIPNGDRIDVLSGIHSKEALERAETEDFEGSPLRVVSADYLAVLALAAGRSKDWIRILALLESASTDVRRLEPLAERYGLASEWERFKTRFLDDR